MSTTQATLHEFHDPAEFETVDFAKTLVLNLAEPTPRKRDRLDFAIAEAAKITQAAADRMPSVPRERWGVARPKRSTWHNWAKGIDHDLPNNVAHENIQRVRETFHSWQRNGYDGDRPQFDDHCRCSYRNDYPKYRLYDSKYYLSVPVEKDSKYTIEREILPIKDGDYIRTFLDSIRTGDLQKGRGELIRGDGSYRFHQVIRKKIDVLKTPETAVGVDIGLTNLAVVGGVRDGEKTGAELWSGSEPAEMRTRFHERKQAAQTDREANAIGDEEQRYTSHVCHTISRQVVEWAMDQHRPEIVLENLTGIRQAFLRREREHTASERRALHSWPFRKLQDMIEYKAIEAGIPVSYTNPRNTSRTCNECGHVDGGNREGIHFECASCGYQVNADVNAAFNIAESGA